LERNAKLWQTLSMQHADTAPIATYQTTAAEYFACTNWLQRRVMTDTTYNPLGGRLVAAAVSVLLVGFFAWMLFTWQINLSIAGLPVPEVYTWSLLLVPSILVVLFFVAQMLLLKRRISTAMINAFMPRTTTLVATADGLRVENGISPLHLAYAEISRLERLGDGYAITSGLQGHYIPRRGFKTKADERGFLALMQQQLKPGALAKDIHAEA
jgi:hypothetical protein